MKRQYSDTNKDSSAVSAAAMFSNHHLHRSPHHFIQPYSSTLDFHQNPFPFQLAASHDVDEDNNSAAAATTTPDPTRSQPDPNNSNDGASIEVQRRPRGRPPGSKNKPKPPVILTRQPDPIVSPTILEVANGVDVIDALQTHSLRRRASLCILSASGAVMDVTIRQPSPNSSSTVTFHGRFEILSLSATFIPPSSTQSSHIPNNVAVSLSVPQGQIIGGIVAGPLTASGTVFVVAALFSSSAYLRLPEEDEAVRNNATSSGGNEEQSPSPAGDNNNNNNGGGGESGGVYNSCSLASDVIWAPSARKPY